MLPKIGTCVPCDLQCYFKLEYFMVILQPIYMNYECKILYNCIPLINKIGNVNFLLRFPVVQ